MKKFAVFDIDGTLVRWQLYHALVDKLAKNDLLGEGAHEKIHEARMRWKNREHGYGFSDYELELIHQFESAIKKLDPAKFNQVVDSVIDEYKDQVYIYTRNLISKLKANDYMLLAVSGSQKELVEKIAAHYGFDDFVGTDYARTEDQSSFSGDVIVASHDKKAVLQKLVNKHELTFDESYAVGDSKSDATMLELVENPIAFNPDKALFDIAEQKHWDIVVERKNVIYKLNYQDGNYKLIS